MEEKQKSSARTPGEALILLSVEEIEAGKDL